MALENWRSSVSTVAPHGSFIQERLGRTLDADAKFRRPKEAILAEAMRLQTIEDE